MDEQERLRRQQLRLAKENPAVQKAIAKDRAEASRLAKGKPVSKPRKAR